jgi:aminopeptidase N
MIEATRQSLAYYSEQFSPYQHRQVRIVEFPRYAQFAQSFPNTIPFSESIGFIAKVDDETDIDYPFYVTAHEVAHQWWAHQVIGANVQGATVLSETLSQYSALMVMEKAYGKNKMRRFLKYELDSYLQGRSFERKKELPLVYNENQQYIHYRKGSVVMYALRDYIGEDSLNTALARYIDAVGFQEAPYTTSLELLGELRAVTPDSLQYVLDDMFESITLYENRVDEAVFAEQPGRGYLVELTVNARKVHADSLGNESEVVFNDWIDIGVFEDDEEGGELDAPLYLQKHRIQAGENRITIMVDREPVRAGIDPYNKLVDRNTNDNVRSVTRLEP